MRVPFLRHWLPTPRAAFPSSRKLALEALETRLNPGVIAFSQAVYNVANNAGNLDIAFVRTGDTRTTDTVNVASSNGSAVAPTDYTAVNGTITFTPSVTNVPLEITIHQNSQPGDRSFTLDLSSPSANASLGSITHATVNITDSTSQNASFVNQLYQTLLNRVADTSGLAFFTNQLDAGTTTRQDVSLVFLNSTEYRTLQIDQWYQTILGRGADSGGVSFALGELNQGETFEQIQAQFYASDEYFAKIGSGSPDSNQTLNWIDAVFEGVLNRHADSGAIETLETAALEGLNGRTSVAFFILTSGEADQDRVEGYYQTFLNRTGDPGGVASWVLQMQQGLRDENVEAAFLGSPEFFASV